ncbi:MAG: hypothetical protein PHT59_05970 [Candidatus Omnitrophica bacterium]|nr:hypothetical protein [Candidatus Omnitrophota bacterium]
MVNVVIYTPERLVFQGKVQSVVLPGEQGVFEVLAYHKPLVSRLISGVIVVGEQSFAIRCGIAGVSRNRCIAVIEE